MDHPLYMFIHILILHIHDIHPCIHCELVTLIWPNMYISESYRDGYRTACALHGMVILITNKGGHGQSGQFYATLNTIIVT